MIHLKRNMCLFTQIVIYMKTNCDQYHQNEDNSLHHLKNQKALLKIVESHDYENHFINVKIII